MSANVFWGLFFLLILMGGIYLMVVNPLSKRYFSPRYFDLGLGGFLISLTLIYTLIAYMIPLYSEKDETVPCGKKSPQAICYGLDTETCSSVWDSYAQACEEEVKPIRERRPTALIYPLLYKCHAQKFDKITFYNRRKSDTPFCREYFQKIDRAD